MIQANQYENYWQIIVIQRFVATSIEINDNYTKTYPEFQVF